MKSTLKASLEAMSGGLFMMIIFTAGWAGLAAYYLQGRDYGIISILFIIVTIAFIRSYLKFNHAVKGLADDSQVIASAADKTHDRWFLIIVALEGVAIFITANILINMKLSDYFIPSMALIVGLHFFPLALLFKRKFDNFTGAWMCIVALVGLMLTNHHAAHYLVVAIVGTGCALATAANGTRMILKGNQLLRG